MQLIFISGIICEKKERIVYNALTILNRMISIQEEMVLVQLGNVAQTRRRPGADQAQTNRNPLVCTMAYNDQMTTKPKACEYLLRCEPCFCDRDECHV